MTIQDIDIYEIDDRGRIQVNGEVRKLNDNTIRRLRDMYPNEVIAVKRELPSYENVKGYKLSRSNKYANSKIKNKSFDYTKIAIIAGVIVIIGVGFATYCSYIKSGNKEYKKPENNPVVITTEVIADFPDDIGVYVDNKDTILGISEDKDDTIDDEFEEVDYIESLIYKYSNIYHLNGRVVYDFIASKTDNFLSDDYLENKTIAGITCKGNPVFANSEEELLLCAVRCIAQTPYALGISDIDYKNNFINNGYVSDENYVEQVGKYCDILGVDKCMAYAIIQSESKFNSPLFNDSNNPAGLRDEDSDKFWDFPTKEAGIIETIIEIRKFYDQKELWGANIDYIVDSLAVNYAPKEDNNPYWVDNVKSIYEEVSSDMESVFGVNEMNQAKVVN